MIAARTIYHLAKADFLERTRGYRFLLMLGLSAFLGYQVAAGNVTLRLDVYQGLFNSAWVASLMSLVGTFFIGWFGFYLIKGSINHDRQTGVGQIMASTPLTRTHYMLGKWLSYFLILISLNLVLVAFGVGIQLLTGGLAGFNLLATMAPLLFVTLPMMVLVAAIAVLFETIPFLAGGFGNAVYFIGFLAASQLMKRLGAGFEPMGLAIFQGSMSAAAKAAYPAYNGGFALGAVLDIDPVLYRFEWTGVDWTPLLIGQRLTLIIVALLIAIGAGIFFDRFEMSRPKRVSRRQKRRLAAQAARPESPTMAAFSASKLSVLSSQGFRFGFTRLLDAELRLLLKGQRRWWYLVAVALAIVGGLFPADLTQYILPALWLWPLLLWSKMGNREHQFNTSALTFSALSPLWRQLPVQWLAGFLITFGIGFGAFLRLVAAGEWLGLVAFFSGALFIPSLALAAGVWSRSSKLFEVIYMTIVYVGPLNGLLGLDFTGTFGDANPEWFIPLGICLLALAFVGRARQLSLWPIPSSGQESLAT